MVPPMQKPAPVDHEIQTLLRNRYSPRAFDSKPLPTETLRSLFEAARWAPSSMNEQPWRFVLVRREVDPVHATLVAALSDNNQRWAKDAPVLIVAAAALTLEKNGNPNRHAFHDLGLASAQLLFEVYARGLVAHPMGGYDQAKVRACCEIPEGFETAAVWAVGHPGDPNQLPEDLRTRELAPRARKPQSSFVFEGAWGRAFPHLAEADVSKAND